VGLAASGLNMKGEGSEVETLLDFEACIFLNYQQCYLMAAPVSPVELSHTSLNIIQEMGKFSTS